MVKAKQNYKLSDDDKTLIETFRDYFVNTGGNDVVEMIERTDVNFFNNYVAAAIQTGLYCQLLLLRKLRDAGKLMTGKT